MAVTLLFVIGRAGSKHHVITDAQGVPLALRVTAANVHDSRLVDELIDAVPPVRQGRGRPRQRPAKLHADKAYDLPRCHQDLHKRRIGDRIARRGIESSQRLGRYRWVVERTQAGLAAARRLGRTGGRPPKLSEDDIRAARAMLANPDIAVTQIAQRLGVSPATLYRYLPAARTANTPGV